MFLTLLSCAWNVQDAPPAPPRTPGRSARKADLWTVDCNGAGEFTDITSAIKEAHSGDRIEVAPCTYAEQVDFRGREIAIVATGGPEVTFISAPVGEPAVRTHRGEGPGTVLEGFTITGGGSELEPIVEGDFSTLHLRDCVITGTTGTATVYARSAIATLERVSIDDTNVATGGFHIEGRRGQVVVKDSTIACNGAVGYGMEHGAAFLDGATFECTDGMAALVFHSNGRVQRSRIAGVFTTENEAVGTEATTIEGSVLTGGVSAITTDLALRNTVISGNGVNGYGANLSVESSIITGAACGVTVTDGTLTVLRSDFWDTSDPVCGAEDPSSADGNLRADPLFVDASTGDFSLSSGSPCIDAGSPEVSDLDLDGSRNDIGAWGGPFTMAGAP